jgi:hypothetical protein
MVHHVDRVEAGPLGRRGDLAQRVGGGRSATGVVESRDLEAEP